MTARPMSPKRLAELEQLAWHSLLNETPREELRDLALELSVEVRRLQSALNLSARHTPFSSEPCPLCLHAGETCAMHRHIDSLGESLLARLGERDAARSRLDISESHGRDKDARIAALERDLAEANLVIEQQDRDLGRQRMLIAGFEADNAMLSGNWTACEAENDRLDARIAALETGLREALGRWEYPNPTHADKAREDELWQLLQANNTKETA